MNLTHSGAFIGIYAPFCEVFRKGLWLSAMHPEGLTFFRIVSSIKLVIYHETQVCSLHYSLTFYCCLLIYQLHKLSLQNYSSSSAEGFFSGFFQEPISPSTIVLGAKGEGRENIHISVCKPQFPHSGFFFFNYYIFPRISKSWFPLIQIIFHSCCYGLISYFLLSWQRINYIIC